MVNAAALVIRRLEATRNLLIIMASTTMTSVLCVENATRSWPVQSLLSEMICASVLTASEVTLSICGTLYTLLPRKNVLEEVGLAVEPAAVMMFDSDF